MPKTVKIEMPLNEAMYLCACLHGVTEHLERHFGNDPEMYSSISQLIVTNEKIQKAIVEQSHPDEIDKIANG